MASAERREFQPVIDHNVLHRAPTGDGSDSILCPQVLLIEMWQVRMNHDILKGTKPIAYGRIAASDDKYDEAFQVGAVVSFPIDESWPACPGEYQVFVRQASILHVFPQMLLPEETNGSET